MKFFALLAVASMAIAAPVANVERAGPGKGPVAPSSSAPAPTATQDCYNNACGGGYPWKRDDEVEERAVEVIEERAGPGKGPVAPSSSAPAPTATQDCYNNACGGGYPWKRDDEVEERAVEIIEERAGPGKGPVAPSSSAPAPTATQDCYNNACGGGYPW